jgi:hypothetical protein
MWMVDAGYLQYLQPHPQKADITSRFLNSHHVFTNRIRAVIVFIIHYPHIKYWAYFSVLSFIWV